MTCHGEWTFDGVRLSDFGVVTELDSYLDLPPKRSDNVLIPMRHGKVFVPKYYDSRVLSFGVEMIAGNIPELEDLFDGLKALIGTRAQKVLMNSDINGTSRSSLAEVVSQLGVTRDPDPLVAKVVIDFLLSDPFFRGSVISHQTATMDANPYSFTLHNPGTAEECKAILTLNGASDQCVITNTENNVVLEYNDVIAGGESVAVDCGLDTAVYTPGALNVIGKIVHSGDAPFMVLVPGDNIITIEDITHANLFTVDFDFYPPYL
jgi:phage-related protein